MLSHKVRRSLRPCLGLLAAIVFVLLTRRAPAGECAVPSDHFGAAGLHDQVVMGDVMFREPIGENGVANPLNILDCDSDGTLELFITVSPGAEDGSPARPAEMRFRRGTCDDNAFPTVVSFVFTQGGPVGTWSAFDPDGTLVDSATSNVSGTKQSVVLVHPSGIARVVITGIRLCIERVCWDCTRIAQGGEGCADPAEVFTEAGVTDVAHLGPVVVTEATFPHGAPAPLTVMDCDGGGGLDLFIRWSQNEIAPVTFFFPVGCGKRDLFPEAVAITFKQGFPSATWKAYDSDNQLVDTEVTAGAAAHQTVVFNNAGGIRKVEVLGQSICVDEVCWRCELEPRGKLFRRGDADADGELSINDAIRTLNFLFLGTVQLTCEDAADSDDDGTLQLNDPIRTLNFLFLGGPRPTGAGVCAEDPTEDDLGCNSYGPCEV
jgi:hypothetical protein